MAAQRVPVTCCHVAHRAEAPIWRHVESAQGESRDIYHTAHFFHPRTKTSFAVGAERTRSGWPTCLRRLNSLPRRATLWTASSSPPRAATTSTTACSRAVARPTAWSCLKPRSRPTPRPPCSPGSPPRPTPAPPRCHASKRRRRCRRSQCRRCSGQGAAASLRAATSTSLARSAQRAERTAGRSSAGSAAWAPPPPAPRCQTATASERARVR